MPITKTATSMNKVVLIYLNRPSTFLVRPLSSSKHKIIVHFHFLESGLGSSGFFVFSNKTLQPCPLLLILNSVKNGRLNHSNIVVFSSKLNHVPFRV